MKIRKDWRHPSIWSSSKTPGPRSSVISCRMMKKEDPWAACKSKWFRDSCLLHRLFFFSHLRKKMKLAFSIVFAALWNRTEKIFFYFKLTVWRLKTSASAFMVEVWLEPPQQNLLKQPRVYARRNTLPYPSSFFSFLPFVQQLVLSALYFSSLRNNLQSQRTPEWEPEAFQSFECLDSLSRREKWKKTSALQLKAVSDSPATGRRSGKF